MRVLLPLNECPNLDDALALAQSRCAGASAASSVVGLWVIDSRWRDLIGDEWMLRESVRQRFFSYLVSQERDEGEAALREFTRRAEDFGLASSVVSEAGDPAEVVGRMSANFDLVVLAPGTGREARRMERKSTAEVVRSGNGHRLRLSRDHRLRIHPARL